MTFRFRITALMVESGLARGRGPPENEKAPVNDRSPLVAVLRRRLVRERAGNAAEGALQVGAEALDDGDDRNRDAGGDETVFDGRGARLVLGETREKGLHELAP